MHQRLVECGGTRRGNTKLYIWRMLLFTPGYQQKIIAGLRHAPGHIAFGTHYYGLCHLKPSHDLPQDISVSLSSLTSAVSVQQHHCR